MKAIKFDDELTDTAIKNLFKEIDIINKDEEIILYFCSMGGDNTNAHQLADYINRNNCDRFTIIIDWECSSAAFFFLCNVKCKVIINEGAFAIIHLISNELNYRMAQDPVSYATFSKKHLDEEKSTLLLELSYAGFDNDELHMIDTGRDIILDSRRMKYAIESIKELRGK